jgi:hypothetical protein
MVDVASKVRTATNGVLMLRAALNISRNVLAINLLACPTGQRIYCYGLEWVVAKVQIVQANAEHVIVAGVWVLFPDDHDRIVFRFT